MSTADIVEVSGEASIARVAELAGEIWREYFTPILGPAQVEYMLEKFQSVPAISRQILEGCHYYFLRESESVYAGYFAIVPRKEELFLSKIYILRPHRGKGYGRCAMSFIEEAASQIEFPRITLIVNKKNRTSVEAYKKMGFTVYDTLVQDIGRGFIMEDLAMEKRIRQGE